MRLLPHEIIYAITFFLTCGLFTITWDRRHTPGGTFLLGQLVALAVWVFGLFFEALSTNISTKVLWTQICYFGFIAVTPFFFLFILTYTSQSRVKPAIVISLFIVPVFILLSAWTNQWHHLLWSNIHWGSSQYNILIYDHGILYFIHSIYLYVLVFGGLGLLIQKISKSHPPYRFQLIIILIGCLFPILSGTLYLFNINPVPGMDIASFGFLLTNIVLVMGFTRYRLLDLVPIARETLIERFQDGMIVVDWKNRIIEINQPAKNLFRITQKDIIGKTMQELLPRSFNLEVLSHQSLPTEYCLSEELQTYVDLQVSGLMPGSSDSSGYLMIFRDISFRKQIELQLKIANESQQNQIDEINHFREILKDQATHDSLTGLYNRRPMDDILTHQLAQSHQHHQPFTIIVMDLDHFKNVNDEYGHQAGDALLEKCGKCILSSTRASDFSCRFGGDEFLMAFQNMSLPESQKKAEIIRQKLQAIVLQKENRRISVTVSIGIATYPIQGDNINDLISLADQASYDAKEKGGNQVVVAPLKENVQEHQDSQ
jgi:diguanylate cyclase (GGDEF)-like protein/PAS domain S-box-containing protein